jgi:hypothetical protein
MARNCNSPTRLANIGVFSTDGKSPLGGVTQCKDFGSQNLAQLNKVKCELTQSSTSISRHTRQGCPDICAQGEIRN